MNRALRASALAAITLPGVALAQSGPAPAPAFQADKCFGLTPVHHQDRGSNVTP